MFESLLGSPVVESFGLVVSGDRLRVLAYHAVPDPAAFSLQMAHLARRYRPVSGFDVLDALLRGRSLPRRSVWVTFDDGRPDVVSNGLEVLERFDIPATLFVCPGLVTERRPMWRDYVNAVLDADGQVECLGQVWTDRSVGAALKRVSDRDRRAVIESVMNRSTELGLDVAPVVDLDGLDRWLASGRELGNHTWDHPCLDRCTPEEQKEQITRAHEMLTTKLGAHPRLFAYPNGDWSQSAEDVLDDLGYELSLLFDHRLAGRRPAAQRFSRLRLDSDAPMPRVRAVLSGSHSALFHAAQRTRVR